MRGDDGDDDDDDDDKPQEWYTGGAQSGSVVQDPKKKPTRVEDILDGARAAGAVDGTAEDLHPSGSNAAGARRTVLRIRSDPRRERPGIHRGRRPY